MPTWAIILTVGCGVVFGIPFLYFLFIEVRNEGRKMKREGTVAIEEKELAIQEMRLKLEREEAELKEMKNEHSICPYCHARNKRDARKCAECGGAFENKKS